MPKPEINHDLVSSLPHPHARHASRQLSGRSLYYLLFSHTRERERKKGMEMGMAVVVFAMLLLLSCGRETAGSQVLFMLDKSEQVVKTDAGEIRVVRGIQSPEQPPINLAFISMDPGALFVPQYLDSSLVFFVRRGNFRIGWIYQYQLVEKQMKPGDVNRIAAGSIFYIINTGKAETGEIICAVESINHDVPYNSFFIGGGTSLLSGFDRLTLAAAFNTTAEEIANILETQTGGPILKWDEDEDVQEGRSGKRILKLLGRAENGRSAGKRGGGVQAPNPYNLYDMEPVVKNEYGWSSALDESNCSPLKDSGIGLYIVSLSAGSILAPHWDPATAYGIMLAGSGSVQVVFPNGTSAMNTVVYEGDVFWIPRYFPMCHVASQSSSMEFFGFMMSSKPVEAQFLPSVLTSMMGPELAAGFGTTEERLRRLVGLQEYQFILPPSAGRKEGE